MSKMSVLPSRPGLSRRRRLGCNQRSQRARADLQAHQRLQQAFALLQMVVSCAWLVERSSSMWTSCCLGSWQKMKLWCLRSTLIMSAELIQMTGLVMTG